VTRLQPRLPAGYRLAAYDILGSTNDEAKRLAREGTAADTVVWALQQTAGRGRRGRRWLSPAGNLYASLVLRPDCLPARAAQLSFVAALAVGDAVQGVLPATTKIAYKWPNDVMIDSRKIAGILLESEIGAGRIPAFVVIGIGINLATAPCGTEIPASCVAAVADAVPAPSRMLEALVSRFDTWRTHWLEAGFAPIRSAWLAAAAARGTAIRVRLDSGELQGRFRDIDGEGALLLDTENGSRRIAAGEVFPAPR